VSLCKIAALMIATTAIGVAQGIPSQKPEPHSVEPLQVPETVTSRLLCGSVAPLRADGHSKESRKTSGDHGQGDTFCGSIRHPLYPEAAKRAGIQGRVILEGVIGKDGVIRHLKVLEGHPMLTSAALDAVKDWRYKPYQENGEKIAVKTTVTVNFTLKNPAQGK
jgi:TonB family protein